LTLINMLVQLAFAPPPGLDNVFEAHRFTG
jgi:hypothetical protein